MLRQFKYAIRQRLDIRLYAVGAVVVLNIVFLMFQLFGFENKGLFMLGMVLSSLALTGNVLAALLVNISQLKSVFSAPTGYLNRMVPVSPLQLFLPRIISTVVLDLAGIVIGIMGLWIHPLSWRFGRGIGSPSWSGFLNSIPAVLYILLGYTLLIACLYFGCALAKSLLYKMPGRKLLAVLGVVAALYLLSWSQLALIPFGVVKIDRWFISVYLAYGLNWGILINCVLQLLCITALVAAAVQMTKQKGNV